MASMTERHCKCCGKEFSARTADVKRGWARFCSKSCKATKQYRHTASTSKPALGTKDQLNDEMHEQALYDCTAGWDEDGWL